MNKRSKSTFRNHIIASKVLESYFGIMAELILTVSEYCIFGPYVLKVSNLKITNSFPGPLEKSKSKTKGPNPIINS